MKILLTGGAGYIGSHLAVAACASGHEIVIYDNLHLSSGRVIDSIKKIVGAPIIFVEGDVRDTKMLESALLKNKIDAVVHLAGLKSVRRSVQNPVEYYSNNVMGAISVVKAMQQSNINLLVFSSSATVYGAPLYLPYDENHPTSPCNPYGNTKLQIEVMLRDLVGSDAKLGVACLRYFNPVGAHESGLIGDDPPGIPENLMPYIARVASGELPSLRIYGDDYETPDGTGARDYIHVMDLVEGHLSALNFLKLKRGFHVLNLGSGRATSVMECIKTFEMVNRVKIPLIFEGRRKGDLPTYHAQTDLSRKILGWKAKRSLDEICISSWHHQINLMR